MKINDDHMYHGAALIQIAEHPQFTAINAFKYKKGISRSSFAVNDLIGVYLKYASQPTQPHQEYVFNFNQPHLDELKDLRKQKEKVFLGLVCVGAKQICCISYERLHDLIMKRADAKGQQEDTYSVLVTVLDGRRFRVYANAPGERNKKLGEIMIPRSDFPGCLFS